MLRDLVIKNRRYRRFFEDSVIERETLVELVELGRFSASAATGGRLDTGATVKGGTTLRSGRWMI